MNNRNSGGNVINVLLVDDSAETRENVKKLLSFEEEFRVVGSVGTGREGIKAALELKPDIIIMDINMPDMDGITATAEISRSLPTTAVIMMSVQIEADYMRKAMQAGARYFLGKPVDPDELYGTIRNIYRSYAPIRGQFERMRDLPPEATQRVTRGEGSEEVRAGNIIVVYSPSGGTGTTTIATNLAAGLLRKNIRVLIIDADVQFGDVGLFLKLNSQSTLVDLVPKVDDLDTEFFDTVVASHETGLKVLLGPQRPELAEEIEQSPTAIAQIIEKVADSYDFIIVDTRSSMDNMLLSLTDIATKIILVTAPTLASVKNAKFVIDLFDKLGYPPDKTILVLNRMEDERSRSRVTIPTEAIEKHLKRHADAKIPDNPQVILPAITKGVPIVTAQRDRSRSPVRELMDFADLIFNMLIKTDAAEEDPGTARKKGGIGLRLSR